MHLLINTHQLATKRIFATHSSSNGGAAAAQPRRSGAAPYRPAVGSPRLHVAKGGTTRSVREGKVNECSCNGRANTHELTATFGIRSNVFTSVLLPWPAAAVNSACVRSWCEQRRVWHECVLPLRSLRQQRHVLHKAVGTRGGGRVVVPTSLQTYANITSRPSQLACWNAEIVSLLTLTHSLARGAAEWSRP